MDTTTTGNDETVTFAEYQLLRKQIYELRYENKYWEERATKFDDLNLQLIQDRTALEEKLEARDAEIDRLRAVNAAQSDMLKGAALALAEVTRERDALAALLLMEMRHCQTLMFGIRGVEVERYDRETLRIKYSDMSVEAVKVVTVTKFEDTDHA